MYLGLFQLWNKNRFENPVDIVRKEVMLLSRIGSTHSYYKTIKDLHEWGYIEYIPSKNPLRNSVLHMIILVDSSKQIQPIEEKQSFTNMIQKSLKKMLHSDYKPESKPNTKERSIFIPPTEQSIKDFFRSIESTDKEASRFFNHYTSNGWLVGGKSPMFDWQASARKWTSNTTNIRSTAKLNQNKKYDEPL